MQLTLYKGNANRAQKRRACSSGYAEMLLTLYKGSANRAQKRRTCSSGYAEMPLTLYKKVVQIERRSAELVRAVMPRCSLPYTKVIQPYGKNNQTCLKLFLQAHLAIYQDKSSIMLQSNPNATKIIKPNPIISP